MDYSLYECQNIITFYENLETHINSLLGFVFGVFLEILLRDPHTSNIFTHCTLPLLRQLRYQEPYSFPEGLYIPGATVVSGVFTQCLYPKLRKWILWSFFPILSESPFLVPRVHMFFIIVVSKWCEVTLALTFIKSFGYSVQCWI
jgi:hypothetical protein